MGGGGDDCLVRGTYQFLWGSGSVFVNVEGGKAVVHRSARNAEDGARVRGKSAPQCGRHGEVGGSKDRRRQVAAGERVGRAI